MSHSERSSSGRVVRESERLLIADELSPGELFARLVEVREEMARLRNTQLRAHRLAEVELLLGNARLASSAGGRAKEHFRQARRLSSKLLGHYASSETYRILAEAIAHLSLVSGPFYQIANGTRARDAALAAVDLDWTNPRAHIALALYYLNAPAVAGGSVRRGLAILQELLQNRSLSDVEQFLVYVRLAEGHEERGDSQTARIVAQAALELFPVNRWARSILARL